MPTIIPDYVFLKRPTDDQVAQLLALYREQGWWSPVDDDANLLRGIVNGSHCFAAAAVKKQIIGMGRAISDGVSDAYIQDLAVTARHQGQGVGKLILTTLIAKLRADGIGWIGVVAEKDSYPFYLKNGFHIMEHATALLIAD